MNPPNHALKWTDDNNVGISQLSTTGNEFFNNTTKFYKTLLQQIWMFLFKSIPEWYPLKFQSKTLMTKLC
jgi:hypothetical protein